MIVRRTDLLSQPLKDVIHPNMSHLYATIQQIAPRLNLETGPWLAGGALRRLIVGSDGPFDIDIFSNTPLDSFSVDSFLVSKKCGVFELQNAIPVQITIMPHGKIFKDVADLLQDFDFTVCMFATDGKTLVYHPKSMLDLCDYRLRTLDKNEVPSEPIKSFTRFIKYCSYGYIPDLKVLEKIESVYPFFGNSYYSKEQLTPPNDQVFVDLSSRCFEQTMVLSVVGDIMCETVEDRCYAFVAGVPLPIEIGFLYFYADLYKSEVISLMNPVWNKLGIDNAGTKLQEMQKSITPLSFLSAVRQAINP